MSMPSVPVLCECLRDLVEWQIFAQYLPGIGQADINIIQKDKRDDLIEQKRALYEKWLHVHPNASWDDVTKALENPAVRENAIAQQLRDRYLITSTIFQRNKTITSSDVISPEVIQSTVSEDIVTELDALQNSFIDLTQDVKGEVEQNVNSDKTIISTIAFRIQEEQAFSISSLESVQKTDELFKAIRPHYNFLNCYLIVSIALFLCGVVAEKATQYHERIKAFMKTKKIKHLRSTLKRYCPQRFRGCSNTTIVEIEVENGWGDQHLWLVRNLIETLFPVKHPDELQWYEIVPGSVIMTFIAFEHMTSSLIESSRKKTEFMRLIGVISLKIGDELVWQRKDDGDAVLSFEDSLIRATLADNIEAVQFILQYIQVDINTRNSTLIQIIDKSSGTGFIPQDKIISTLRSFRVMFEILVEEIEQVLQYMNKPSGHPHHEFLNSQNLSEILLHLPKPLSRQVEHYIQSLERMVKKRLMIPHFTEYFLAKYFPTPFPGSIKVTICLYSTWSTVWYVEQLGQLIFTPALFHQLQWFKVDTSEEAVCFLADRKIMSSLKECVTEIESSRLSMLGVASVQVDDTVMIVNDYSDGYTFHEAIELAKTKGDNEIFNLLHQVLNPAKFHYGIGSMDANWNYSFHPHPDSTPLMIACCNDDSQLVQLLLDHNADPNIRNGRGATALMYSTGSNKIFQMLLDHGAEHANMVTIYNESLIYCACFAGNVKVVKKILQSNDDPSLNMKSSITGNTPLILASTYNHAAVVKMLLEAGADPDIQNMEGRTALMHASINVNKEIVEELLLANADPDIRDNDQKTAVHLTNNKNIVDQLVKANANLNVCMPLLQQIVLGDRGDVFSDDLQTKVELEELKHKISTYSAPDKVGISLCVAILWGETYLATTLTKQGNANPNISFLGITPLLTAIEEGYLELIEKLLQAQADPNMQDDDGRTPLMIAYDEQEGENQRTLIQMLLQANANPNLKDGEGSTVLIKACHDQDTEIVNILLEAKADPNILDVKGDIPLVVACNEKVVRKLLQAKADPNIQDGEGTTPLMIACSNDDVELVSMLLQAGADPTIINHEGNTALDYAGDIIIDMMFDTINKTANAYILLFLVAIGINYLKSSFS